jgi:hypothetical protein
VNTHPSCPQASAGKEPDLTTVSDVLNVLEAERRAWLWAKRQSFHPNFGSEFTSGTRPTLFASLVMVRSDAALPLADDSRPPLETSF